MKHVGNAKSNKLTGSIDISGFFVPKNKRIVISLQSIYGVGEHVALQIINKLGLDFNMRMGLVSDDDIHSIREYVKQQEENGLLGNALRRQKIEDIARLKRNVCYRGLRHSFGMPLRGQNTHSNQKRSKRRNSSKKNNK